MKYLEFIESGGYKTPELWLSDGWDWVQSTNKHHPEYWTFLDNNLHEYTLHGLAPLDPNGLVCHINYFEASAFAQWKNRPEQSQ